jgi:glutaredoxin-like protein NrdH
MVDKKHVKGKNKGDVMLYALSTCGWCKKTKRLLDELGIEYHYVDVDLVTEEQQGDVLDEVKGWNPRGTFPTLVVNDECIVGYKEEKIKEVLGA